MISASWKRKIFEDLKLSNNAPNSSSDIYFMLLQFKDDTKVDVKWLVTKTYAFKKQIIHSIFSLFYHLCQHLTRTISNLLYVCIMVIVQLYMFNWFTYSHRTKFKCVTVCLRFELFITSHTLNKIRMEWILNSRMELFERIVSFVPGVYWNVLTH